MFLGGRRVAVLLALVFVSVISADTRNGKRSMGCKGFDFANGDSVFCGYSNVFLVIISVLVRYV